jgi:hypothetical protein
VALTSLSFLGLATFPVPGWHSEDDARTGSDMDIMPFPSRPVTNAVIWALGSASLLLMVSALWQHVAAAAVVALLSTTVQGKGVVVGEVGTAAIVVAFQGIVVMALSIRSLDRLEEE